jgi:transducin (beta)-like 1
MTGGVFSSEDVNILVYRYLLESGFTHTAFMFNTEASLSQTAALAAEVPPGALVAFLAKGLEYVSIEEHVDEVSKQE